MNKRNCIVVVDMQRDFVEKTGSLYVKEAETSVERMNEFLHKMDSSSFIIASKDWHPANHCSFKNNIWNIWKRELFVCIR